MQFKEFNRGNISSLREELNQLFSDHGIEGVKIDLGSMRYGQHEVSVKVKVLIEGKQSREETALNKMCEFHGFVRNGRNGEQLVEYHSKKYKFPWIYVKNGKRYKASYDQAKYLFSN